jgi:iron complex outermembrane receptor protein
MRSRILLFAGAAALAITAAAPAYAGQDFIDDDVTLVDPLIITTERREQNVQDVPVAVTAIDDVMRNNVGILTIEDITQFTPGMAYNTTLDRPTIRGIGRQSNTFSIESPVANYIDGVYTSSVQDADRRPIFIDRTEILRGPQGALSGRGSIAGAINTISKRPRDYFESELGFLGGNFDRWGAEGTITGPITDWLNARANIGVYVQDEGFFQNVAFPASEGDQPNNRQIYDLMFNGDITDKLSFFLKGAWADYSETRRTGASLAPYQAGNNPCSPTPYGGGLVPSASYGYFQQGDVLCGVTYTRNTAGHQVLGGVRRNPVTEDNLRLYNSDMTSNQRLDDHHNYTAELIYELPFADVKYIGGHQNYIYTQFTDADGTAVTQMRLLNTSRIVDPSGVNMYQEEREWYSNEINLTSTHDGPLQWVAGLFQSVEDYQQQPASTFFEGYPELNTPLDGVTFGPTPVNVVDFRPQYGQLFGESTSSAVFGQVDYSMNDAWKFTFGLRYNKDEKEVREQARFIYNNSAGLAEAFGGFVPLSLDITRTTLPGFSTFTPGDFDIPAGATVIDPAAAGFPLNGGGTAYIIPDGLTPSTSSTVPVGDLILLDSSVLGLPTTDPETGYRIRLLETEADAVVGTLGADYSPNDDMLFYARYARGYRPSGLNAGFISSQPEVLEETVDSYEIGAKLTLGGALRVNTAAFFYDYKDIQQPLPTFQRCVDANDLTTCTAVNSFVNLPEAETKGIEIEGIWMPTNNFQAVFSYGWLDTEITDGLTQTGFTNTLDPAALDVNAKPLLATGAIDVITGQPVFTQDLTGNPLQNSPEHKIAANANYTFNFGAGDLTLSGTYIWQDEALTNLFGFEPDSTPSYDQVNFRALWRDSEDRFTIIASVRNLFDEDVAESAGVTRQADQVLGNEGTVANQVYYPTYNLSPPRTFLVEVFRRF